MQFKKSLPVYIIFFLGILLCFQALSHDDSLYRQDILLIRHISLTHPVRTTGVNDQKETSYTQKLTGVFTNGKQKDHTFSFMAKATASRTKYPVYHPGTKLFIKWSTDTSGTKKPVIAGEKRDQYTFLVIAVFLFFLTITARKETVFVLLSVFTNLTVFCLCLAFIPTETLFQWTWVFWVFLFTVITLLFVSGFHKKTLGAILSTLLSIGFIALLYNLVVSRHGSLPYGLMEYISRQLPFSHIYMVSVLLGSLGAVMDVSIIINSTISTLYQTNPDIDKTDIVPAIREISYDIMGTMINILFFSYVSSSLPLVILKLHSGYSIGLTINTTYIFDIVRFLIGSIGITAAIPIAALVAVFLLRPKPGHSF